MNIECNTADFQQIVDDLVTRHSITGILESGTFHGLGSTTVFARTNLPVVTFEVNTHNYVLAKKNLANHPNVTVLNERTVPLQLGLDFIARRQNACPDPQVCTNDEYSHEITGTGDVPDTNTFLRLVADSTYNCIFLDSAAGIGYLEFMLVFAIVNAYRKPTHLLLDDVYNDKHYDTCLFLTNHDYNVNYYDRFAHIII